jgi:C4-dicarboxylate-specific signal transduction histidine kinase
VLRELIGVDHDTPATFENFFAQILPEDRLKVDQEMREMAEIGRTMFSPFRVIHPEGSIHWLQNIGHPVRLGDELSSKYIGALVDTTEEQESLKIIEAQRVKMTATSKMTALGEMAGGLAHEINNPVAIIHGNAIILQQLAAQGNMLPDQIISMARVIAQTAERISKITRSLLAFARDAEHDPFKKASILKIVEETAEFCQERFHEHGVSFLVEEISSELEIECRPVQITQVLLNLLNNAYDAVENQADHWIRISVGDMGDRVEIYVTDSGKGIDESVREKIFQPFFTTKEVGRGTGLGLSMAAGIVESHAGTLVLDWSFPHTRFIVSLPKIQKMLEERKSPFIIDG